MTIPLGQPGRPASARVVSESCESLITQLQAAARVGIKSQFIAARFARVVGFAVLGFLLPLNLSITSGGGIISECCGGDWLMLDLYNR